MLAQRLTGCGGFLESTILTLSQEPVRSLLRGLSIVALLVLGACSSVPPERSVIQSVQVKTPKTQTLPKPTPIDLVDVKWIIVRTEGGVVMALTPRQYQNLSNNLAEVLRYVKQADSQLDYYRRELGQ